MPRDSDSVVVVCPHCGRQAEHEIGWIKDHAHFRCSCGRLMTYNYDKFLKFLREEATYVAAKFMMDASLME